MPASFKKWLLQKPENEPNTDRAMSVVESIIDGREEIVQPTHWLAEVAGVLARLSPANRGPRCAATGITRIPINDDPAVMQRATQMAVDLGQHVFDTLYHAVAIEHEGAQLITADDRYFLKGRAVWANCAA